VRPRSLEQRRLCHYLLHFKLVVSKTAGFDPTACCRSQTAGDGVLVFPALRTSFGGRGYEDAAFAVSPLLALILILESVPIDDEDENEEDLRRSPPGWIWATENI
jgi:hypothetical protein